MEAGSSNGSATLGGGVDAGALARALGGGGGGSTEGTADVEGSPAVMVGGELEGGAAFFLLQIQQYSE